MPKKVIRSPKVAESTLPLSQATLAGNVLYIGGAVAHDARGRARRQRATSAPRRRRRWRTSRPWWKRPAGPCSTSRGRPSILTDLANYAGMNEVYATYFPVDPPSRATVRVDLANPEFLVEIQATAVLG